MVLKAVSILKFTKLFLALVLFLITASCFSQEKIFYHYGLEEGLSQQSVRAIIKDSKGYLWVGTQDGLNRFDGNSFVIYKNEIGNDKSISGNFINALLDNDNLIWIGTSNNGICYYNKKFNNFKSIGNTSSNCTGLAKDIKGNVFATYLNNGLSVFSIRDGSLHEDKVDFFSSRNLKLTAIVIGNDETLYVGTKDGRFFYTNLSRQPFQFKEIVFKQPINEINRIAVDGGSIWLGTTAGLYFYDISENNLSPVSIEKFSPNSTEKLTIHDIWKKEEQYFVATDNGLFVLSQWDKEQISFNECVIYVGDKNNTNSITSNRVYALLLDKDLLWIGTNKLDALSLVEPVFKTINVTGKKAINNNHVFSIYKANDYLFIGTRGGLDCIDAKGKVTTITKESTNNKLAYNVIRGIVKDDKNNLWLATTKGVSIINLNNFDPARPKIKSLFFDNDDTTSLSNNDTRHILIDNKKQVWVATYGGGINKFTGNLATNTFTFQRFVNQNGTNALSSDLIYHINQDTDNNYWIATTNGLNKLHFTNDDVGTPVFTTYLNDSEHAKTLQNIGVLTTFHDAQNILWIGTDNGLYKYDRNTNELTYYGEKDGLTNSVVYSILEDADKDLWLSTNSGLFRFNKTNETFTNYTGKDGIQGSEFNLGAQYWDPKTNELYFGGVNGFNYFNSHDIDKLYKEGNLTFTSLKIKGKEIDPNNSHTIIDQNITDTKDVYLKFNEFPSYLSFSDLSFSKPENSGFVYKLIPNDEEWNELNDRKEIQLLNLAPGDYTLQVQGKIKSLFWKQNPLEIRLHVSPPWHKSNFAYFLYLLLTLGFILFMSRFFLQRRFEQREVARLKELNNLKTKLYANITHEFRTPITVILGMAQTLRDKLRDAPIKTDTQFEMIERNSNNLLNLVNQILDLSKLEEGRLNLKLEQGNIITHLKYLTESFHSIAEEKQISIIFYNEDTEIIMDYDRDKISQIISNLMSNAVKFCTKKDKIIVHVSRNGIKGLNQLIIKIKDTGIGISRENIPFIFDRFYQVKTDAGEHGGTGIGLALTKDLIVLMNGEITVESKEKLGTTFTVKLPITQNEKRSVAIPLENVSESFPTGIITPKIADSSSQLPIALIVEDNSDVSNYIIMCLEDKYQILYAPDGEIGIEMAMAKIPDIVISDVLMPKKNGFELCEILKKDIRTDHIPIILLTAKATQADKMSGLSFGADAYLIKPFQKEELLLRMEKLVALRKILQQRYRDSPSYTIQNPGNKNDEFINKIIAEINNHLDDSSFQTEQLARAMHLSESQLYRKLKALTNTSTAIFIRKVRLQNAKKLFSSSDLTVSEVAYSTGFNDPSWFSKCFKEEFGHPPSEKSKF